MRTRMFRSSFAPLRKREVRPAELPALGRQSRVALGRASWQSDDVIDLPDQER
jgi:hypothetical protein